MRIITSPAKKMVEPDTLGWRDLPCLLDRSDEVLEALRMLDAPQLQKLWNCSDALARLNVDRLRSMDLRRGLTPAILAYEGIQYRHMAPSVMTCDQLDYLQEHLRVLSGLYGVLRPFDGVTPYRLEMQAKLHVGGAANLYDYWADSLAQALGEESDGLVVNVASVEYARAVVPHLGSTRVITCLFGEVRQGRLVQRATQAKAARGQFIRWCAETGVSGASELKDFAQTGWICDSTLGNDDTLVFVHPVATA